MRTIVRILIILFGAVLVAGATFLLVDNGVIGGNEAGGRTRPEMGQFDPDSLAAGEFERSESRERGGGREEQNTFLSAGLLSNLGTIALIVAAVVLGQWLWSLIAKRRPGPKEAASGLPPEKMPDGDLT